MRSHAPGGPSRKDLITPLGRNRTRRQIADRLSALSFYIEEAYVNRAPQGAVPRLGWQPSEAHPGGNLFDLI